MYKDIHQNGYVLDYITPTGLAGIALVHADNPVMAEGILKRLGSFAVVGYKIKTAIPVYLDTHLLPSTLNCVVSEAVTAKGERGSKGAKGDKGNDGKSAYEIAVLKGFIGTEEEWLKSLKGKLYKYIKESLDSIELNINDLNSLKLTPSELTYNNKELTTKEDFITINGYSLIGNDDLNVALYSQLPQVQTSYSDAVNHYINSDGYTDSNKCALSAKNTTILQGTKGTWSEGKLLFRKGRWGDDGYSTIAIPTATTEFDGLLSKEDKAKVDKIDTVIDKIDTVEETANNAAANASFATSKIGDLYNELGSKQPTLISGENIKTINGESILGSGDVTISGGDGKIDDVKVNGTSVVTNKVANIDLSTYASKTALNSVGQVAMNAGAVASEALESLTSKLNTSLDNITESGKNVIKYNTGIFVAKYNVTPFEEVRAAINDGKKIIVENLPNGSYLTNVEVSLVGSNFVQFYGFRTSQSNTYNGYVSIELNGNGWITQKTGEFEENANKKSTITDSTTYYPNNKAVIDYVAPIKEKIEELETFKFPNLTIFGTPTIQSGQMSNFSATNYAQFPFLVDFRGLSFEINMCFTTGNDINLQHNIFDSDFGLAFAIRNSRFVFAGSSNGSSWDMGEHVGTYTVEANTTYYTRFSWNGSTYKLEVSTDKVNYTTDVEYTDDKSLYPKQIVIGKAILSGNTFVGSINLNYCNLLINEKEVWLGMDDVGLASRAATDLSNLDAAGEAKIKEIAECNVFIAEYGVSTYEEVKTAHESGKKVLVNNLPTNVSNLEIQTVQNNFIIFKGIQGYNQGGLVMIYLYAADNNWIIAAYTYFQEKNAKLETITSAATNEQYPSAKAVYDFVNNREWYGTQAEFDALEEYNEGINYYIYD